MNIKEHIEAGHYPSDEKGRALVPVENEFDAWTATICATDGPGGSIIGFGPGSVREWGDDGKPFHSEGRLLPPPPRKVEVKAWAVVFKDGDIGLWQKKENVDTWMKSPVKGVLGIVELTGSYEEPW